MNGKTQNEDDRVDALDRLDMVKHSNPMQDLETRSTSFDWGAIDGGLVGDIPESERIKAEKVIRAFFQWLLAVDMDRRSCERLIGRRAIALAWAINPDVFDTQAGVKKAISLRKLAIRIGLTPAQLSPLSAEASRVFGVKNDFKKHDWKKI